MITQMATPPTKWLETRPDSKRRLMLADRGFIGMACSCAEISYQICFIVGCTSPVVLRETGNANKAQYMVMGTASIYLLIDHKREH